MTYIQYSVKNRIGFITLNRPEKRNALNQEMVAQLKEAFSIAEADENVKVIILNAQGESFCAGADLAYLQQLQDFSYDENFEDSTNLKDLFLQIYTLKKVVIAQVQGHALAGGCGLATVCDFTFAVPEAKFGYTEVKIGFVPAIVMVFLLRKVGEMQAKHLLLSGNAITAEQALQAGLIYKLCSREALEKEVLQLASSLIEGNSAHAMMLTKQMIAEVQSLSLNDALDHAAKMNAQARSTPDCQKGIASFLAKEKIAW